MVCVICDMLFSFFFKSKVEQSRGEENPKPKQRERERAEEPILSTLCCDTTNTSQAIQHTVTPLPNGYFHFISLFFQTFVTDNTFFVFYYYYYYYILVAPIQTKI